MALKSKIKYVLTDITSVVKTVEHFINSKRPQVIPVRHKNIQDYTAVLGGKLYCGFYLQDREMRQRILITILNSWHCSKGKVSERDHGLDMSCDYKSTEMYEVLKTIYFCKSGSIFFCFK